ncbi:hypothetical protein C8Q76DRAFT_28769 [Earliella scabrosa]|nr:hypothetical protein C8Q76DRAFT_28769 [Earliella scabrosa]
MLTTDSYYERVKIELARNFDENGLEDECANLKRIRVISAGRAVSIRSDEADRCFEDGWKTLIKECELVCTRTGIRYAPLPKPQAVILDMLSVKAFDTVKLLSGDSVQVYSWLPCAVSAVLHIFGPENLGGKGDIHAKAEEKARSTGESFNEVALEMTFGTEGKIVETPGMPPMFDYEHYPQHLQIPRASALFFRVHESVLSFSERLCVTHFWQGIGESGWCALAVSRVVRASSNRGHESMVCCDRPRRVYYWPTLTFCVKVRRGDPE